MSKTTVKQKVYQYLRQQSQAQALFRATCTSIAETLDVSRSGAALALNQLEEEKKVKSQKGQSSRVGPAPFLWFVAHGSKGRTRAAYLKVLDASRESWLTNREIVAEINPVVDPRPSSAVLSQLYQEGFLIRRKRSVTDSGKRPWVYEYQLDAGVQIEDRGNALVKITKGDALSASVVTTGQVEAVTPPPPLPEIPVEDKMPEIVAEKEAQVADKIQVDASYHPEIIERALIHAGVAHEQRAQVTQWLEAFDQLKEQEAEVMVQQRAYIEKAQELGIEPIISAGSSC